MNLATKLQPARPQAGLSHLVAHAWAAELRMADACRPGAEIDEHGFGEIEKAAVDARAQVREVITALGINPDMLAAVLS